MTAAPAASPRPEKWLIVGGGLPGLVAARLAARRGGQVRLIEQSPRFGGVNASIPWNGFQLDFGCHLFGNERDDSTDILLDLMDGEACPVNPRYASIVNGRTTPGIEYPNLADLGPDIAGRGLLELVEAAAARTERAGEPETLFDWLSSRYGETVANALDRLLFKMTRAATRELAAEAATALPVARATLTSADAAELLKTAPALDARILAPAGADAMRFHRPHARSYPARAFYPASGGMGGFTSRALDRLAADGVETVSEAGLASLESFGGQVRAALNGEDDQYYDYVVWTAGAEPLARLAGVEIEAKQLLHATPMVLWYFDVSRAQVADLHYVQSFDADHIVFRASIPTNYGGGAPEGRAYVCCEAPTDLGSDIWMHPEQYAAKAWSDAQAMGIAVGGAPADVKVLKTPQSYKLPREGARALLAPLQRWLDANPRILAADPFAFAKSGVTRRLIESFEAL